MRIAVISDTHGNYPLAIRALEQIAPVELLIHLGDGCEDMEYIAPALAIPTNVVAGNCDRSLSIPRELLVTVANTRILITHGDIFRVKFGLDHLVTHARNMQANLVLFGHTHYALVTEIDGLTLVNPGPLAKGELHPSIAVVTIVNGTIGAEIIPVKG